MVKISDQKLIESVKECYDEHGEVAGKILNDSSNDYPTQPTYSYRFDNGLSEACGKAGVPYQKSKKYSKEKIIELSNKFFEENGELGLRNFNNSDDLPSSNRLYKYFDSIDSLIQKTNYTEEIYDKKKENKRVVRQNKENYTKFNKEDKDSLIEHLWWVVKEYGNAKTVSVNKAPGPSSNTYKRVFGSLPKAREVAGIKEFTNNSFEHQIGEIPDSYDKDADGYIYAIKMIRLGTEYYYVGMSTSLRARLNSHANGNSKIMLHHENKYDTLNNLDIEPHCIVRIENYYKNDEESKKEFRDRLKSEEHIISHQISAAFNTDKVLGGRS